MFMIQAPEVSKRVNVGVQTILYIFKSMVSLLLWCLSYNGYLAIKNTSANNAAKLGRLQPYSQVLDRSGEKGSSLFLSLSLRRKLV
jgi:hypothetical protein